MQNSKIRQKRTFPFFFRFFSSCFRFLPHFLMNFPLFRLHEVATLLRTLLQWWENEECESKFNSSISYLCKVRIVQKWSKFFFLKHFISFGRARRALQKCIWKKKLMGESMRKIPWFGKSFFFFIFPCFSGSTDPENMFWIKKNSPIDETLETSF